VVGPGLRDQILGNAQALGRGQLLQTRLPVQAGPEVRGLLDQRVEEPVDQLARGLQAPVEIDRADDGLQGVGQDRGLVPAARALLAAAEPDERAEVQPARDLGQGAGVDHGGAQLRELALREVGMQAVEGVGDHQTEHGVAEELEALVGRQTAVLIRVRAMGQCTYQKGGLEFVPEPPFQSGV
jgi:hypothetical protein